MVILCEDDKVSFKQATVTDCDEDNHETTTMRTMMTMTMMKMTRLLMIDWNYDAMMVCVLYTGINIQFCIY